LRRRPGVSVYIEVFILIAAALAATGVVYSALGPYEQASSGPSISASDAMIRQGANQAVERVLVTNTGTVAFSSLTLTNLGAPATATYCLSLLNPSSGAVLSSSCPAGTNPSVITATASLGPGQAVLVSVTVYGTAFTPGNAYNMVISSGGSQTALQVTAVPA
jgi:hypothetical protein